MCDPKCKPLLILSSVILLQVGSRLFLQDKQPNSQHVNLTQVSKGQQVNQSQVNINQL